jgi:S1-C subfamily serine protease
MQCLLIARKGMISPAADYRDNKMKPGEARILNDESLGIVASPTKRPLGLIRFFEVSDVGLTLDGCKVTKVTGPLAKAGVKVGDVLTHVDGVAVKDAEALRKALRRRYAILGFGAFTLTREGKPLTVVAELGE